MTTGTHYDVIIIGSGAGGGTLAHALAPTGKNILILERGDYVRRKSLAAIVDIKAALRYAPLVLAKAFLSGVDSCQPQLLGRNFEEFLVGIVTNRSGCLRLSSREKLQSTRMSSV